MGTGLRHKYVCSVGVLGVGISNRRLGGSTSSVIPRESWEIVCIGSGRKRLCDSRLHVTTCLLLPLRGTTTNVELVVRSSCRDEDVCVNHVLVHCECLVGLSQ